MSAAQNICKELCWQGSPSRCRLETCARLPELKATRTEFIIRAPTEFTTRTDSAERKGQHSPVDGFATRAEWE